MNHPDDLERRLDGHREKLLDVPPLPRDRSAELAEEPALRRELLDEVPEATYRDALLLRAVQSPGEVDRVEALEVGLESRVVLSYEDPEAPDSGRLIP